MLYSTKDDICLMYDEVTDCIGMVLVKVYSGDLDIVVPITLRGFDLFHDVTKALTEITMLREMELEEHAANLAEHLKNRAC